MEQSAHGGSGIAVSGSTDVVLSNLVEQWTWQYWINNSISEIFSNLHNSRIERCLHGLERHFSFLEAVYQFLLFLLLLLLLITIMLMCTSTLLTWILLGHHTISFSLCHE